MIKAIEKKLTSSLFSGHVNCGIEPELECRRFEEILPVPQFAPLYPDAQLHNNVLISQVPP